MIVPDQTFPRQVRLLKPAEYKRVFENPVKSSDRFLTVLARDNTLDHPRLGLAISKKALRRATDRNRVKRLVREVFRQRRYQLASVDFVVMARSDAKTAEGAAIKASLGRQFEWLVKRCASRCCNSSGATAT